MFVTVGLRSISHTKYVDIFMIYPCNKCHATDSNGLSAIPIKPKAKDKFRKAMLLLYTLQQYLLP
jgi:hypothetical protein